MANKKAQERSVNVPLLVVLALVPVIAGLIWYANKRGSEPAPPPAAASAEAKEYVRQLKLGDVEMKATENFAGAAVIEITGNVRNGGDRTINRVELNCVFYDVSGLVVLRERVPIVRRTLKPGETAPFRLPFEGVPQSWNQAMPQLVIAQIDFS